MPLQWNNGWNTHTCPMKHNETKGQTSNETMVETHMHVQWNNGWNTHNTHACPRLKHTYMSTTTQQGSFSLGRQRNLAKAIFFVFLILWIFMCSVSLLHTDICTCCSNMVCGCSMGVGISSCHQEDIPLRELQSFQASKPFSLRIRIHFYKIMMG